MSSGTWGPGQAPGDGSTSGRGTAGEAAPSRTESARPLIAWAALLLALICVAAAFATGMRNGVLVLGTVFAVVFIWAVGGFTRAFWREFFSR